jgi:hypothetical protein
MIQQQAELVAKPVDRFTDPALASIMTAVIKNIQEFNDGDFQSKQQFTDGIICGLGVKEIFPDVEETIEGDIRSVQDSPWHYYLDPRFEKYDYSDGRTVDKEIWMTHEEIEQTYGKKVLKQLPARAEFSEIELLTERVRQSFDVSTNDYGDRDLFFGGEINTHQDSLLRHGFDFNNKTIRIIEHYEMMHEKEKIFFNSSTSETIRFDDMSEEEQELIRDLTVERKTKHIRLTTVVGGTVLAEDVDLEATEFHQLFNFYFPWFLNGKYWGIVENLFDPQDEINYKHSTMNHILATHDNSGVYYEEEAVDPDQEAGLKNELGQTGMATKVLDVDKIKEKQVKDVPPSMWRDMEFSHQFIKHESGASDAIAGTVPRQQSGRAKQQEIAQSAVKLAPIIDNLHKSMKLEGLAFIHWIQNFYAEERVIRIMGTPQGGAPEELIINSPAFGQIFNDTSIGKYDITLEFEGKTQSERERTKFFLTELANTVPQFADIIAMQVLQYSELPQKEAIIAQFQQRQQQIAQQAAQEGGAPQGGGGRGPIQSAPRPSQGPRRQSVAAGG